MREGLRIEVGGLQFQQLLSYEAEPSAFQPQTSNLEP